MTIKELEILAQIVDTLYLISNGDKARVMYKCSEIIVDIKDLIFEKKEKGEE